LAPQFSIWLIKEEPMTGRRIWQAAVIACLMTGIVQAQPTDTSIPAEAPIGNEITSCAVPEGTQAIAPSGGTTVQEGVTEDAPPACCADGSTPGQNGACPEDVNSTTSNSGANADDSVSGDPVPQMR
jgi:hypothetical protein